VSVNDDGIIGNGESRSPIVSNNGRWVSFDSLASRHLLPQPAATVNDSHAAPSGVHEHGRFE